MPHHPRYVLLASAPLVAFSGTAMAASPAASPQPDDKVQPADAAPVIVVTGHAGSILGTRVDPRKVPNATRAISADDIARSGGTNLADALSQQVGSVNVNAVAGNPYQPDLSFRGFTASPVEGTPIGIAVYQNGVRVNEGFGDTVNWDLIPTFAIRELNLTSANPVFGLNALGGALALQLKNGFTASGGQAEVSGGSFGQHDEVAQYAVRAGDFAVYGGVNVSDEAGWRTRMPSHVRQGYLDLGYRHDGTEIHLSNALAVNRLSGTGPTPPNLLATDYGAGIDYPGTIENTGNLVTLSLSQDLGAHWRLDGNLFQRHFLQHLANGAPTSSVACAPPLDPTTFCSANSATGTQIQLVDSAGNPVPLTQGGAYPGEIDVARTLTNSWGGALQLSSDGALLGRGNHLILGGTVLLNTTRFSSDTLLGAFDTQRDIDNAIYVNAPGGLDASIRLRTLSDYASLYLTDTFDLTDRLSLTASAGYNHAHVALQDLLGGALNGTHDYHRLNPSIGATWQIGTATLFANYSQDNRVPTPAELSCADPGDPCNLASFFVADPALRQVVSKTVEFGLRGKEQLGSGDLQWSTSLYRAINQDDIVSVASSIPLHGYFENAGRSRRQGADLSLIWKEPRWRLAFDYSYLDAVFLTPLTLSSPFNPAADASGDINVVPGDRLPGLPRHRVKFGIDYAATPALSLGATLEAISDQVLRGDEGNQTPPLPGYALLGLHASVRLAHGFELFGSVSNLANRHYYTSGTFTTETGLPMPMGTAALAATRTYGPGEPRAVKAGIRVSF